MDDDRFLSEDTLEIPNDLQLHSNFKQWLQNFGETSRSKLLVPVERSVGLGLYESTAQKMTDNLVPQHSFNLGSQAEQSSSTDNSSGEVREDVAAENAVQSANVTDNRIPVDEVSRVDNKFSQVDAQTQTCSSFEAEKQDFDQASASASAAAAAAAAEDNSLPDVVFSSTSSSGQSQVTSPDVLLSGPFPVDTKSIDPLSVEQNAKQCPSPPESQSPEGRSAKKCMMSSGYATQGSELSELSMAGSYDDDIFSPPDDKDTTKLWRLLQPSSMLSGEFPSSGSLITVRGKDEEEKTEAGLQSNLCENDREENLSTEANVSSSSSANYLQSEWRDKKVHKQLTDLATQMIRGGKGVAYIQSQLEEKLNSLASESENQEETIQDEANEGENDLVEQIRLTDKDWIRFIQMAASCGNKDCDVDGCCIFQELLIDVEDDLRKPNLLNLVGLQRKILLSVAKHSRFCSKIHCSVPWCFFFNHCDFEHPAEQLSWLMSHYRSIDFGIERMIDPEDSDVEFLQFDLNVNWPSVDDRRNQVPTSGLDFEISGPAGEFGQIAYYAYTAAIPPKLLLIRMHSTLDGIHAWTRLRQLQHPNVVRHLWAYIFCKRVVICSEVTTFGEKSLKDVLKKHGNSIPMETVLRYMVDIISATEFLNRNSILYLLWTVDSIGVTSNEETVLLRDFSCAVDESRLREDDEDAIGIVCAALPPIIIPPEMFANDIGSFSEIWGMGCLLFHLTTGSCVNRHLLHEDNDTVHREVKRFCTASSLESLNNDVIRSILKRVFVEKSHRLDSDELKAHCLIITANVQRREQCTEQC